jgi:hypothetical protein
VPVHQIPLGIEVADDDLADDLFFLGIVGQAELPQQMPFQGRFARQPGLVGHHFFQGLGFLELDLLGRAGKIPQIIFPVRVADQIGFFVGEIGPFLGARSLNLVFLGQFLGCFLQHGIFQEFLLHGFEQLEPGQLEQFDGLLQLGSHDQLLGQFEVLPEFKAHSVDLRFLIAHDDVVKNITRPGINLPQKAETGNPRDVRYRLKPSPR